ncbi:dynamin family protein [Scytonema hofmannii PCC 7110]|uniref:Dynamin family protein n=1 Tax=Scytonema hofmannii PCC 7110 TaxID=128403 RepID=A0A139XGI6_9CYAN|nr:dynamin family protein [Scytonema hofmannii]KYC43789.1 dynamin family protein [Scytonema hofmannii PCC 7110]
MQPQQQEDYQQLADTLKSASALLNLDPKSQLYQDTIAICNHLTHPNFRIAVFGPFNHGKSTLINAMLGDRALPIDLIPTTGAAIIVRYGTSLRTRIMLTDGTEVYRNGTEVLKQFAVLDNDRRMRSDVASVEVFCPHPFLDTGVEFLDLPGTNDREEQDNLVRQQLLGADLVVQLLDARKLMTLGEREHLRDWLLERGIKTVIFVANFINLLEPEDQKQVQNRLRFVAESFRSELPPGFSNLYRVDALPALRARLKGDVAAASSSGLVAFESALQSIVSTFQQNSQKVRLPRVESIAVKIQQSLQAKITPLQNEIKAFDEKQNAKHDIKIRAEQLIKQGFSVSLSKLRGWLALSNLQDKYQADAAVALAQNSFKTWEKDHLQKDLKELQQDIVKWLYQAYEFFQEERPEDLFIPLPDEPKVILPSQPGSSDGLSEPGSIAVGGGIGWLLGGPIGAAVVGSISYLVNKKIQQDGEKTTKESYHQQVAKLCLDAVDNYLICLSDRGLSILSDCDKKSEKVICFLENKEQEPLDMIPKRQELWQLQNGLYQLYQQLEKTLKIPIPAEVKVEAEMPKPKDVRSVYRQSGKGVKEEVGTKGQGDKGDKGNTSQIPSPPPPNMKDVEAKFRAWEIDEEIAQMKANTGSSSSQASQQQRSTQSNKVPNQPSAQTKKEKIQSAYTILGLQAGASQSEVKQAYRTLVKKWHPDLFVNKPQQQKQAQEKMRLINEAYALLDV